MLRTVRQTSAFTLTSFAGFFIASKSDAQDGGTVGAELAGQLHSNLTSDETLKNALQGNPEAMFELVLQYGPAAVTVIVVMIIGYLVSAFVGRTVGGIVSKKVDVTLGRFMTKAIRNGLMFVILLGVLSSYDVDVTSFAAVIAALGFAIGMALQGTLANFAAGVMLLVFRPFKVDDYIVVAGSEGNVEEIDLFTTRLNTLDNRHLIIPNGEIFGNLMENYSRNEARRVDVNVGAAYSADLTETRQVLSEAIARIPGALSTPDPQVYLCELGASSVDWQLRVYCRPEHYFDVRERVTAAAKESMDAANIGIPFPQLDVHVVGQILAKSAPSPVPTQNDEPKVLKMRRSA